MLRLGTTPCPGPAPATPELGARVSSSGLTRARAESGGGAASGGGELVSIMVLGSD